MGRIQKSRMHKESRLLEEVGRFITTPTRYLDTLHSSQILFSETTISEQIVANVSSLQRYLEWLDWDRSSWLGLKISPTVFTHQDPGPADRETGKKSQTVLCFYILTILSWAGLGWVVDHLAGKELYSIITASRAKQGGLLGSRDRNSLQVGVTFDGRPGGRDESVSLISSTTPNYFNYLMRHARALSLSRQRFCSVISIIISACVYEYGCVKYVIHGSVSTQSHFPR